MTELVVFEVELVDVALPLIFLEDFSDELSDSVIRDSRSVSTADSLSQIVPSSGFGWRVDDLDCVASEVIDPDGDGVSTGASLSESPLELLGEIGVEGESDLSSVFHVASFLSVGDNHVDGFFLSVVSDDPVPEGVVDEEADEVFKLSPSDLSASSS